MTFEERFFGPGNGLRWESIQGGKLPAETAVRIRVFLDELASGSEVCALPRVLDGGGVLWYILCRSSRSERLAREQIRAFVGPSYSTFDGHSAELDPTDPVEAAVLAYYGSAAFRVEVPPGAGVHTAEERFALWLRLRRERPSRVGSRARATGRVLRDFEYALSAGDGEAARACIEELRAFGRLDGRNLTFLEVRRLASLRRWADILGLPEFGSLISVRRPHRVTEAIITAIYVTEIEPLEREHRHREAVEHFRREIRSRFADLYRSRRGLVGEEVTASFVLAAMSDDPARFEAAAAIADGFVGTPERREWLDGIVSVGTARPEVSLQEERASLDAAWRAFAAGDLDGAVEIAGGLAPSVQRAMLLLRCARDVGTTGLVRLALDAFDGLSETDKATIEGQRLYGRIHEELLVFAGQPPLVSHPEVEAARVPTSWSDWLGSLTADQPWSAAVAVAEVGVREWSMDELVTDPTAIDELAQLISARRPAWGEEALRDASPYLIDALLRDGPRPALQRVYDELLLFLLTEPNPSVPLFRGLVRLVDARLGLAVTSSRYAELLEGLGGIMDRLSSPAVCEPGLDALEMLVSIPCPHRVALEGFFARTVALLDRWYRRVDALQKGLLLRIGEEIGLDAGVRSERVLEAPDPADPLVEALSGMTVALYSLNEGALRRTASALERFCPGVSTCIFSDTVGGSPRLRAAASSAHIFVLTPGAAKHAATSYIAHHRPEDLLTLNARGRGSTGMLAVIRENTPLIQEIAQRAI